MYSAQEWRGLLDLTNVFSTPKKERYYGPSKAKAVIETHPNVFDLEFIFITIITRLWNYIHTSMSNVRTGKKKAMFSALLNKSDDPYCDHTQLRPKLQLYPNQPVAESRVWLGFSLRWQKWTRESLLRLVTSAILKPPSQSILWGEQGSRTIDDRPLTF